MSLLRSIKVSQSYCCFLPLVVVGILISFVLVSCSSCESRCCDSNDLIDVYMCFSFSVPFSLQANFVLGVLQSTEPWPHIRSSERGVPKGSCHGPIYQPPKDSPQRAGDSAVIPPTPCLLIVSMIVALYRVAAHV